MHRRTDAILGIADPRASMRMAGVDFALHGSDDLTVHLQACQARKTCIAYSYAIMRFSILTVPMAGMFSRVVAQCNCRGRKLRRE